MVIKILIVLSDGRVLKANTLEEMMELVEVHDFTNTVWISNTGFTELKDKQETLRWIREEY